MHNRKNLGGIAFSALLTEGGTELFELTKA